jgi:hypothetical protein
MADTKITRLRNLMTPVFNYFQLRYNIDSGKYEEGMEVVKHIKIMRKQRKQGRQIYELLPEIREILMEIPDDACDNKLKNKNL